MSKDYSPRLKVGPEIILSTPPPKRDHILEAVPDTLGENDRGARVAGRMKSANAVYLDVIGK